MKKQKMKTTRSAWYSHSFIAWDFLKYRLNFKRYISQYTLDRNFILKHSQVAYKEKKKKTPATTHTVHSELLNHNRTHKRLQKRFVCVFFFFVNNQRRCVRTGLSDFVDNSIESTPLPCVLLAGSTMVHWLWKLELRSLYILKKRSGTIFVYK